MVVNLLRRSAAATRAGGVFLHQSVEQLLYSYSVLVQAACRNAPSAARPGAGRPWNTSAWPFHYHFTPLKPYVAYVPEDALQQQKLVGREACPAVESSAR